jgi:hypothetical protein
MENTITDILKGAVLGGLASYFIPFVGPIKGAMFGALFLAILGVVRRTGK